MPVLLAVKDPFISALDVRLQDFQHQASQVAVRRPLLGVHQDEDTYASLSVVSQGEDGKPVRWALLDQGGARGTSQHWRNFLLQGTQRRRMEKAQIVQTFGPNYYLLFGEEPEFLLVSGLLLKGTDFRWSSEFEHIYEHYLRGSKCAETQSRVFLTIETVTYVGFLVSMAKDETSDQPVAVPLSFNFAVLEKRDSAMPADVESPPEGYFSYTATTGRIRYSENPGQYLDGQRPGDYPDYSVAGVLTTLPSEPMLYDDSGKLGTHSRATRRASGGDPSGFHGRDLALLDLDLVAARGDLPPDERKRARFEQRQQGGFVLRDREAAEGLLGLLTPGTMAGGSART